MTIHPLTVVIFRPEMRNTNSAHMESIRCILVSMYYVVVHCVRVCRMWNVSMNESTNSRKITCISEKKRERRAKPRLHDIIVGWLLHINLFDCIHAQQFNARTNRTRMLQHAAGWSIKTFTQIQSCVFDCLCIVCVSRWHCLGEKRPHMCLTSEWVYIEQQVLDLAYANSIDQYLIGMTMSTSMCFRRFSFLCN